MSRTVEELTEIFSNQFSAITKALMLIDSSITNMISSDEMSINEAALLVKAMHSVKADVATVYDSATSALDKLMADLPEINLEDGTKIEKKTASDRRSWNHRDIATEVARRLSMSNINMETGEVTMTTEELMVEMLRFMQPSYWRVKDLSTIGINADNFCEVLEPKTSIIVRKAKS